MLPTFFFCCCYFSDRAPHFLPGVSLRSWYSYYISPIARITDVNLHAQLVCWDGVLLTFFFPWTAILLISTSWVGGITEGQHCINSEYVFLTKSPGDADTVGFRTT
jgi:hypothetical protein